ncbi:uncharacterized protein LTR77_010874 [Saxophila tyrrhenica]|uniref:Uncharacterized protein n=1 Tax=Saxophila tyrrhenica TaxID=1690608 RepID=A0AAV9NWZ6_9PEZI|nr:hypothetical protein LTR77_010874 [Saxophila tyrrhenica]
MAAIAGSFGGLLAAAISLMDDIGGRKGWAWIFILEGIVTTIVGIASWWMVFDWPDTARFLSPDERIRVQRRLAADNQTHTSEQYDKRHIIAAAKDWKTYAYAVVWMGNLCPLYSFSLFLPTIIAGLGYEGTTAQLMTVPPYAVAAVLTIFVGFLADRTQQRGIYNLVCVSVAAVGFIMLLATPNHNVQYAGTFLAAAGIYPTIPNSLSWAANNFEGVYKRGVVIGTIVGWGNLNGVVSCNIYLASESPRFWTGHAVVLSWQICFLLGGTVFLHIMLGRENKKRMAGERDYLMEGKTAEDMVFMGDQRPDFIYMR